MSKKYFGTDGVRGRIGNAPMTADFVLKLGWSIGKILACSGYGKVLIGKDTRISGYMLESALEAGLTAAGIDVHRLGVIPTPAVAYLTSLLQAQAGIVISASHNPFYDNGIKLFSASGHKLSDQFEVDIEKKMDEPMTIADSAELGKNIQVVDAASQYIEYCKSQYWSNILMDNLKIVIDCANGATYQVASIIFRELGATVIEICASPNGLNINLNCGATHLAPLQERVLKENADLGIAFDGDGDRVMMVNHEGNVLDGDDLLYVIISNRIKMSLMKGGVIGTVMTNLALEEYVTQQKFDFVRVPVGDQHIMAALLKYHWTIGGESSGHIICNEKATIGDGIMTALEVLSIVQSSKLSLSESLKNFKKYPQVIINVPIIKHDDPNKSPAILNVLTKVNDELKNVGRIVLRRSGTEPLVRVMVEGHSLEQVDKCAQKIALAVRKELGEGSN